MPKKKTRLPNLDNATPMSLVDELGDVREQISALKKLEGIYKTALMARIDEGQSTVTGETFDAVIEEVTQSRLDTERIKSEAEPEWLEDHYKQTQFTTIRTTRKE